MTRKKIDGQRSCSFCGKPQEIAGDLINGPAGDAGDVAICADCVQVCGQMFKIERKPPRNAKTPRRPFPLKRLPPPAEIKAELDKYVVGQDRTKKALAVAVNSHYKRIQNPVVD